MRIRGSLSGRGVLDLEKIGGVLMELRLDQAEYIEVALEGSFKPEHCRY
ncbi:MAG: adenosylhomocysteinase [Verrucomicrobiota bacterium]